MTLRCEDLVTIFESEVEIITALLEQHTDKVMSSDCPTKEDLLYSLEVVKGSHERIVEALKEIK